MGQGVEAKDKTFSVYYEKRDGERERGKRREGKIKDVRIDNKRENAQFAVLKYIVNEQR